MTINIIYGELPFTIFVEFTIKRDRKYYTFLILVVINIRVPLSYSKTDAVSINMCRRSLTGLKNTLCAFHNRNNHIKCHSLLFKFP